MILGEIKGIVTEYGTSLGVICFLIQNLEELDWKYEYEGRNPLCTLVLPSHQMCRGLLIDLVPRIVIVRPREAEISQFH